MAAQIGVGANEAIVIGISQRTVQQNPGGATGNLSPNRKVRRAAASMKAASMKASKPARTSTKPAAPAQTGASDPTTEPAVAADPAAEAMPASNGTATETGDSSKQICYSCF